MATMKVSPAHEKFIKSYAKRRELSAEEGLEKILNIAQSRMKALDNYAKADGKKTKKAAKKAAKATKAKAASKGSRKPAAKARKTRKASASKRSSGTPKGFKSNSAPEPEATAEATA